jgi:hypothetical protein
MKREDIKYIVSILLFFSICLTGSLGYIQSELELRKFTPHRYFAYATLSLAAVHVTLNAGRIWRYLSRKFKKPEQPNQSRLG